MMGCHQRTSFFFVLVYVFVIPNVLGECPSPFEDVSSDSLQVRCVYVSPTSATLLTFAEARHACQALDPRGDLIKILMNDITDLTSHSNYNSGSTYYVGVTNAAIASNRENVIDCSTYNPVIQAMISTDECASSQCNCWALDTSNGNLDQKSCLTDQHGYICGLTNAEDYVDVICPSGWTKVKDRCYRYHMSETSVTTFTQAQAVCAADSGNLARVNFYDCNFAGILGARTDTSISYLVGLMGSSGTEIWRDNSMPDTNLIFTTGDGSGDCFVLRRNPSLGALGRVSCTDATVTQHFICERESLIPTTPGIPTTEDGGATTEGPLTTEGEASTAGASAEATGEATTVVDVTTPAEEATTGGDDGEPSTNVPVVTTGEGTTRFRDETTRSGGRMSTESAINAFGREDPCIPNPCINNGVGETICSRNSANAAQCVCTTGFELESVLGPCLDINECDRNLHNCSTSESCVNNEGSFTCECTSCNQPDTGNQGDADVCVNSNDNPCDASTTRCQSTNTGYTCECLGARVRVNVNSCTDQCTAGSHSCEIATTTCVADNEGRASCQCRAGHQPIPGSSNACRLNSGLSARVVARILSIGGVTAKFTESLLNNTSLQFREKGYQICDAFTLRLKELVECRAAGFESGSIIAYLQVTIPVPTRINSYEHMKDVIIEGPLNEQGYSILYTSDGQEVILDPNALDVDDIANYVCRPNTCQNEGLCFYEDRFIHPQCQCLEGFQGTSCEAVMVTGSDDSSTGLLIGLSLLAVVLFIVFSCCFCFVCLLSRRRLQNENSKIFRYQQPIATPPSQSSGHRGVHRILYAASEEEHERPYRPSNFHRIIRNRAVDQSMEAHDTRHDNYGYQSDSYDIESFLDDRRMEHYRRFFTNSRELNSRMSSRADGASVASSASLHPSAALLADHDFYRPYTVDGTENT